MKLNESTLVPKKMREFATLICEEKGVEMPDLKFDDDRKRSWYWYKRQEIIISGNYRKTNRKLTFALLHELSHHIDWHTGTAEQRLYAGHNKRFFEVLYELVSRYYKRTGSYLWKQEYPSIRKRYLKRRKEASSE